MQRPRLAALAVTLAAAGGVGACGDDGGDLDAFCATARRFAADNPASVFDRYDPADPGSAATMLRDARDRLAAWAREAPGRIDGDVEVIAEAADSLAAEFDDPDAAPAASLQARLLDVEAASARVLEFTRSECGVELEPSPPTDAPSS